MFHHDPAMVIPNPNAITMTEPSMTAYTRRNALLALVAGGMPIGGMAAQMQNPRSPELDAKALRDIWFDKLRERLTGLFVIDGTPYDTYRQSWVATVSRAAPAKMPTSHRGKAAHGGHERVLLSSRTPGRGDRHRRH